MRIITVKQILRWLRKQSARKKFPYLNDDCGCLYTQCAETLLRKPVTCCRGGKVVLRYNGMNEPIAQMPSHDAFWWAVGSFYPVTKSKAIKALTILAKGEA